MKKNAEKQNVRQPESRQLVLSITAGVHEVLHDLVVGAGMSVLGAMLEQDRTDLCGPRYAHDTGRRAHRAGSAPGELPMGGRRTSVLRPRVRSVDGQELELPTWQRFSLADPLTPRAVDQVLVGVSTRKYARSLEPMPAEVVSRGTSKSAVSRRFVAATAKCVDEMMNRDLSALDLVAILIDGIHVDEHVVLVVLGIDSLGNKRVLGLREGATENATACTALLADLQGRGMRTDRAIMVVIDGSKALAKAVRDVFGDRALVQRCQVHKRRNVEDQLPERMKKTIGPAISTAYRSGNAERAKKILVGLARQLERNHPGAAASLREGLDETLTVLRLGLVATLTRTLATTNPLENLNNQLRRITRRVKRWRDGSMVVRWIATALGEAAKGFRKLRGYKGMPALVAALRAHDAKLDGTVDAKAKAA
jgi:transposase-like protein